MASLFDTRHLYRSYFKMALPVVLGMVVTLVYNLADTFFIGQTHDDLQVAAVSLAAPVFLLFMSVGTVFGIGGTSVISRALGEGYYIVYFLKGSSSLSISLKDFSVKEKVASGVLAIGVPAALGNLLMSLSSILMNSQMAKYGDILSFEYIEKQNTLLRI